MKHNWIRNPAIAGLAIAVVLTIACGSNPTTENTAAPARDIETREVGDLVVALQSENGELVRGQNRFVLAFRSASGQPLDVGSVTVSASMTMPGMAPMVAPIELRPAGRAGAYALTGDFAMSGAWKFDVRWDGPAGQGSTSFSASVR
jgi:hypothetical protein